MFLFMFIFILFFTLTILWVYWVMYSDFFFSLEKGSSFECGFSSKDNSRLPFSLRFFSFLMLFLLFDVELVVLLFMPYLLDNYMFSFFFFLFFFSFLFISVLEEWRRGFLDWF